MYNLFLFFGFMVSAGVIGNFRSIKELEFILKIIGNDKDFFVSIKSVRNWNFLMINTWDVLLLY